MHVEVSHATKREWEICAVLFAFSMALVTLVYYYKPYINNGFSMIGIILDLSHLDWANYMDILTTSIFLAGMWLMAEKKVE
ncbi:nicotinamide mononucleotide transporter, partial [Staphylococcus aureus]|uniref:nicotinamide mononucleotide transporter n=1 Tax=Staphylococcus aureus TaxID=1280 RepID=UPI00359C10E0